MAVTIFQCGNFQLRKMKTTLGIVVVAGMSFRLVMGGSATDLS
jgi:hypothetical protein